MDNKEKVLEKIFDRPMYHYHIRELARETNLNQNTIINISKKLLKDAIIKIERNKPLVEIFADIDNKKFIYKKKVYNLEKMYSSGIVEFLVDFFNPKTIVLMGSYSRGEDTEKSDIDLAVITEKKEMPNLSRFERILKRKIHIMPVDYKEISDEFFTNIINGIVLYGYLSRK